MRFKAVICTNFYSEKHIKSVLNVLFPETRSEPTSRSKVKIKGKKKHIKIYIEAKDTSALRASINSYLRLIHLIKNFIDQLDKF